jgi:hypothetical protein
MNKREEKIKIEIEKLQAESNYQKFEFGQYTNFYIGLLATTLAIFIPVITYLAEKNNIGLILLATIILLALMWATYIFIKKFSNKNLNKIKALSKKINENYEELLK